MAGKFRLRIEAERLIHSDLSNTARHLSNTVRQQWKENSTSGVSLMTSAALVFVAFSIEAKVNFVGWKVLEDGWPERASFKEKLALIYQQLGLELEKGKDPIQTVSKLMAFRNTLAHGKPDILAVDKDVDDEPVVWDALKMPWEDDVTLEFLNRCCAAEEKIWGLLLEEAGIPVEETITKGHQSLSSSGL